MFVGGTLSVLPMLRLGARTILMDTWSILTLLRVLQWIRCQQFFPNAVGAVVVATMLTTGVSYTCASFSRRCPCLDLPWPYSECHYHVMQ